MRVLIFLVVATTGFNSPTARGQDPGAEPLRLQGVLPAGARTSATESWGVFEFTVVNHGPTPRDARVAVVYANRPDVHYARDVWVPGRAAVTTWVPVGPAPEQPGALARDIRMLLFDRTGGRERPVLPPGEERNRTRVVTYHKRTPTFAVLAEPGPVSLGGDPPPGRTPGEELIRLTRVVRLALGFSEQVPVVRGVGPLPPTAEAFDGIDVLGVAGGRFAADPPGRAAVRRWVEAGGTLWVPLDLIDVSAVAPVLGDNFDLVVVDRVGLTSLNLYRRGSKPPAEVREFDRPVELVRVVPGATDRVVHEANGWPASLVRQVGRGKVVFTTLGGEGWVRPRTRRDPPPPTPAFHDLPVGLTAALELGGELYTAAERDPLPHEALGPLLAEDIGYSVVGLRTAAVLLGGFVLALAVLGIALARSRRPELIGWVGPGAAVIAGAVLVGLGEQSRQSVPPTSAVAELVTPVPDSGEAAVTGLYAVYHPESGPAVIGTRDGAVLDLDPAGLDGQLRRRVQADTDVWAWEGLSLPAGVRTGPFQVTRPTGRVAAVGRFGPAGFEGRLTSGPYTAPADSLILTPARDPVGVKLDPDGAFAARPEDALPVGQYLTGAVLNDRQQRRQAVYRQLLSGPLPRHLQNRDLFLAWADPPGVPFTGPEGGRVVGTALLATPLEYEPTPPDTRVVVPSGFIPYRRLVQGNLGPAVMQGESSGADMRLRFQLPPAVLPIRVERATLFLRVRAPYRKVSVAGVADGTPVPLAEVVAPVEPIRVDVTDEKFLRPDPTGGLFLDVVIGKPTGADAAGASAAWAIQSLSLEVAGRTGPAKTK